MLEYAYTGLAWTVWIFHTYAYFFLSLIYVSYRYVYARSGDSLVMTYFVSAFWHGFYPGYYLFFLSLPLVTNVAREGRRKLRPYFLTAEGKPGPLKPLYDFMTWALNMLIINYMVSAFQALALSYSLKVWKSFYYYGHIACIVGYLILLALPTPKSTKEKKA